MVRASLIFVVVALSVGAGFEEPEALVRQLGAPRYAERQAAVEALREMGARALPALREARLSSDAEVQALTAELIARIEADLLVRPTMVRLDFEEAPLTDIVAAFTERTGVPMVLLPENSPVWKSRRLTLREAQPQTFWAALDRFGSAADLRYMVTQNPGVPGRDAVVQFFVGASVEEPLVALNGPFRVTVDGIHYHQDRNFGASRPAQVPGGDGVLVPQDNKDPVSRQFYLDLKIDVEPRMLLSGNESLELLEAIDDQGNSLVLPAGGDPMIRNSGYFGVGRSATSLPLQVHMRYPERPGSTIRRLKGRIPVIIAARRDDPLVIDLTQAKGKTFETRDVALEIHEIQADPDQPRTTIELTIRPLAPPDPSLGGAINPLGVELLAFRSPNTPQSQVEVLDAQGRRYRQWFPSSTRVDQEKAQISLTLMNTNNELGPPVQLRFYDMNRANSVVEFEFHDIPMF